MFFSEAAMKYLLSRRLIEAATLGANQPFSLMLAMSLLPITFNLPASTYFDSSVLPLNTVSVPMRSLGGAMGGGVGAEADAGVEADVATECAPLGPLGALAAAAPPAARACAAAI